MHIYIYIKILKEIDRMMSTLLVMYNVRADAPVAWQKLFQDPATSNMEGIVDLHADICFFLIVILVLVLWLGARILVSVHHN
jgi:heme/copper-type cytochrome/quinol oxidase subunit 2